MWIRKTNLKTVALNGAWRRSNAAVFSAEYHQTQLLATGRFTALRYVKEGRNTRPMHFIDAASRSLQYKFTPQSFWTDISIFFALLSLRKPPSQRGGGGCPIQNLQRSRAFREVRLLNNRPDSAILG